MRRLLLSSKKIPGVYTLIDDEDYDSLSRLKWWLTSEGYAKTSKMKKGKVLVHYLHRVLLKPTKNLCVDHINGNRLDNRRKNLRLVTPQQNQWNTRGIRNKTGVKGTFFQDGKFYVRITVNKKRIFLGSYNTKKESQKIRREAEKKYFVFNNER